MNALMEGTGTFILMGSAADQASYEANRYGDGLLTYALLEGMRGTALKDQTQLFVDKWFVTASTEVETLAAEIGRIQRPMYMVPTIGRSFPIVELTKDDAGSIPLSQPVPQLLRVLCVDAKLTDKLGLEDALRAELRAVNDARGRAGDAASGLGYDDSGGDSPTALAPKVQYTISGNTVSVHIMLDSGNTIKVEDTVPGQIGDTAALAKMVAAKIVAMALALPRPQEIN
jgi:hypothetical protein